MRAAALTQIYLVRHGETDWNRAQRLQGTIDTSLNRVGVAQAHQAAQRFRTLTSAIVVTSPLARATHTAHLIARRTRSVLVVDPLLAEIDHGSWAGLTLPTIERAFPGAIIGGHLHPNALDLSGGEALAAAYRRASLALQRLELASRSGPVVVVSHGVINALLMCAAVGHVPAQMDQYTQANGCTYRLLFRRRALLTVDLAPVVASSWNAGSPHPFPRHLTA